MTDFVDVFPRAGDLDRTLGFKLSRVNFVSLGVFP